MIRKHLPAFVSAAFVAASLCLDMPAYAQSGADDRAAREMSGGEKPAPMADKEAREKLEAHAARCDSGATAPVDPDGKAPPVHIHELMLRGRPALLELLEDCGQARAGFPAETRFRLQLARVAFADRNTRNASLTELRALAEVDKFEAMYLLFLQAKESDLSALRAPKQIQQALDHLKRAANAGHGHALRELREEWRFGLMAKPNIEGAFVTSRIMAELPSQGPAGASSDDERLRKLGRFFVAAMTLDVMPNVSEANLKTALAQVESMRSPDFPQAAIAYAQALRKGKGIASDPAAARKILEEEIARGNGFGAAYLADMLAHGEGGPQDIPRAMQLLEDTRNRFTVGRAEVAMKIFMDNKVRGREPRRAIRAIDMFVNDIADILPAARLMIDYNEKTSGFLAPAQLVRRLENAMVAGNRDAGLVLADLLLSRNSALRKDAEAINVLRHMADAGDVDAQIRLARMHFTNLESTSSQTSFGQLVLERERIAEIINAAANKQHAPALLLQGELTRKGMIYPQDDRAATQLIQRAAQAGHVPAMISLAKAYDDGLGVTKNSRERVRWLRAAAAAGSPEAKDQLGRAFTFDWSERLLNVREGISEPIAKWANSPLESGPFASSDVSRIFSGSRSREIPRRAMAQAVLDGFRIAPAGLADEKLVAFGRIAPEEIRAEIERVLNADGILKEKPDGFFGPAARDAMRRWVAMKGPLPDVNAAPVQVASAQAAAPAQQGPTLPNDVLDRVRDIAFKAGQAAKGPEQQASAVRMINALARYGDQPARWVLMRNYHKSSVIRRIVSVEEITRYSLDILVSNPPQAEKADFEYIFNLTEIFKAKRSGAFANTVIEVVRDDPRLQESVALAPIFKHTMMSPGGCDALSAALRQRKVANAGEDCSEATLEGVIAAAKAAGPGGAAEKLRAAAIPEIQKIAAAQQRQ